MGKAFTVSQSCECVCVYPLISLRSARAHTRMYARKGRPTHCSCNAVCWKAPPPPFRNLSGLSAGGDVGADCRLPSPCRDRPRPRPPDPGPDPDPGLSVLKELECSSPSGGALVLSAKEQLPPPLMFTSFPSCQEWYGGGGGWFRQGRWVIKPGDDVSY